MANLLSYLLGLIGGLIMFFTQRDREVRFHAAQSILMNIAIVIVVIVLNILIVVLTLVDPSGVIAGILGVVTFFLFLLGIPALVIIMCIQGYQQKHVKLPLIGDFAERWAAG